MKEFEENLMIALSNLVKSDSAEAVVTSVVKLVTSYSCLHTLVKCLVEQVSRIGSVSLMKMD